MSDRVSAGFYKGRAIAGSAQYALNEKNGNESVALDLDLGEVGQFTTFLHFTEAATPYSVERLRACGWKGDDLTNLAGVDANEITVQVKYEVWDGKERMKVDIATGGGRIKLENQMNEHQKRAFAARMRGALKATAGAPTAQAARPAQAAARPAQRPGRDLENSDGPPPDDDIPF